MKLIKKIFCLILVCALLIASSSNYVYAKTITCKKVTANSIKLSTKTPKDFSWAKYIVKWKKVKGAKGYDVKFVSGKDGVIYKKRNIKSTKITVTDDDIQGPGRCSVYIRAFKYDKTGDKIYSKWVKSKKEFGLYITDYYSVF